MLEITSANANEIGVDEWNAIAADWFLIQSAELKWTKGAGKAALFVRAILQTSIFVMSFIIAHSALHTEL